MAKASPSPAATGRVADALPGHNIPAINLDRYVHLVKTPLNSNPDWHLKIQAGPPVHRCRRRANLRKRTTRSTPVFRCRASAPRRPARGVRTACAAPPAPGPSRPAGPTIYRWRRNRTVPRTTTSAKDSCTAWRLKAVRQQVYRRNNFHFRLLCMVHGLCFIT